jgi:ComF family protein
MLNVLFPKVCNSCQAVLLKEEKTLCTQCIHELPLVCHHRTGNELMKNIFFGRCQIESATALLQFQKRGITQQVLHNLKYKGQEEISSYFGHWLGAELAEIPFYKQINVVIPVPLHKQKLRKRGFNQVAGFGKAIASALAIPYRDDILLKISKTSSQVFKKRFTRFEAEEQFTVQHSESIHNQHILLVDDIVTTGATLENCTHHLQKNTNAKVSLATIAIA